MAPQIIAEGQVQSTLLMPFGSQVSHSVPEVQVLVGEGVRGDRHAGTRLSDMRETVLKRIGVGKEVVIANMRELTVVSAEELETVAEQMGTPGPIPPGLLGENLVIEGVRNLSQLPAGSMITFAKLDNPDQFRKAVLGVWGANEPCAIPHRNIVEHFGSSFTPARGFTAAAKQLRGLTCFVYSSGVIKQHDLVRVWRP